jgi:hypothetical protein
MIDGITVLIWPLTILFLALRFGPRILALLPRVREAEVPGWLKVKLEHIADTEGAVIAAEAILPSPSPQIDSVARTAREVISTAKQ